MAAGIDRIWLTGNNDFGLKLGFLKPLYCFGELQGDKTRPVKLDSHSVTVTKTCWA